MTNPGMPALLNPDDYVTFALGDQDWVLIAAGATIRKFCGWHVYPSLTTTQTCTLAGDGTIILKSGHVTEIVSIMLPWSDQTLSPISYWLDQQASTVHWKGCPPNGSGWWVAGGSIGSTNAYPKYQRKAIVEMTHGFEVLPPDVAEVGNELVMRVAEKPAGVAKSVTAGPYSYTFNEFGMYLSESQKTKLSAYRLPAVC